MLFVGHVTSRYRDSLRRSTGGKLPRLSFVNYPATSVSFIYYQELEKQVY